MQITKCNFYLTQTPQTYADFFLFLTQKRSSLAEGKSNPQNSQKRTCYARANHPGCVGSALPTSEGEATRQVCGFCKVCVRQKHSFA